MPDHRQRELAFADDAGAGVDGALVLGLHPAGAGRGAMVGFGFGGHIPLTKRVHLDLDLGSHVAVPTFRFDVLPAAIATARLLFGVQIGRCFAVWGGPTFNADFDPVGDRPRLGYGWVTAHVPADPYTVRMWPGFALGVQL